MKVQFVVLIFAAVSFLAGCAGSGSDSPTTGSPNPPQVSGAPGDSVDESGKPLLTPNEISCVGVKIKARTEHFEIQSWDEKTKRFMAGTILNESLMQVHPIELDKLTESELATLRNYFFDANFNLKK